MWSSVRILGRIIAGLLGLPLLLLGSFALTAVYAPGTEELQHAYWILQTANQLLIEWGLDLPLDASVTLEEWLTSWALRFVVAPVGLILLAVAAGVSLRKKDPAEEKEAVAPIESAPAELADPSTEKLEDVSVHLDEG